MNWLFAIAGMCAIVVGLLQIFNREMAWKAAQASNNRRGIRSERTATWEVSSVLRGIAFFLTGTAILWAASQSKPKPSHEYDSIETVPVPSRVR